MPLNEIENNLEHWIRSIYATTNMPDLESLRTGIIGKSGIITSGFKYMASLEASEKKEYGEKLNVAKEKIETAIKYQKKIIEDYVINESIRKETLDVSLPASNSNIGGIHIISRSIRKIRRYYQARGFLVLDGPEVETEFYNFDALNMAKHHPARQGHDTFYIKDFDETLLRTHTSNVQIRTMIEKGVPVRMISIGRTYRSDALDATHSPMFNQIEGLVVEKTPLNIGHLKSEIQKLLAFFFDVKNIDDVAIRFRPSYFPFTEPGVEIDCRYMRKDGKLVITKDGDRWLELGGAGMVHPNVYKSCGLESEKLYGFAFGFGIERLVMLKNGIQDIRNLYDTDMRWLKHYAS